MNTLSTIRTAKALWSLARLVRDPDLLDEVFEVADALATPAHMDPILDDLARSPEVRRALEERHRYTIDLASLRRLPEGTLGRAFADHMIAAGLDPKAFPKIESNDRISFFRAHAYESHDVWHVVTGFGVDFCGEIGLQGFYLAQLTGGLPALLLGVGFFRVGIYDRESIRRMTDLVVRGWTMGRRAKPLFGVHWDELWDRPLEDVRRMFDVVVPDATGAPELRAA